MMGDSTKKPAKKAALNLIDESTVSDKAARTAKTQAKADAEKKAALEEEATKSEEIVEADSEEKIAVDGKVVSFKSPIIVSELAEAMGLKAFEVVAKLIEFQIFANVNQAIDPEIADKVCEAFGYVFEREKREKGGGVHKPEEEEKAPELIEEVIEEDALELRAPIVTFMGHVDHGKTSLLDHIRKAKVAAGEAGGITQHIGAYQVDHEGSDITFLDTPGHAIFTAMRARGADVTDIIVVVVAADDGLMPQTIEAINHAKAADKPMLVAINKCDLPAADPARVKTQLMEQGLVTVDFGGDIESVEVSAHTGQGVDDLLELINLQAEILELKSDPKANARAIVIESRIHTGRGATASVLVESGTLKVGQSFICGPHNGKVRGMINDKGETVKVALPGTPVELLGFTNLPEVGQELVQMKDERSAKKLSEERMSESRESRLGQAQENRLENILSSMQEGGNAKVVLPIILKGDVQGSVGAIKHALEEIESDKVEVRFLHAAVGSINEADILLSSSSQAVVLGFNTKVESKAIKAAKAEGVQIKLYSVVYELIDQVKDAMLGLLDPETRETVIGHAEVKQIFKLKGKNRVAGCVITNGKVDRTAHARVLRGGTPVFDGKMSTLRRFKDEVKEVKQGIECGIRLGEFNEYEEGDIIECYLLEKLEQTL